MRQGRASTSSVSSGPRRLHPQACPVTLLREKETSPAPTFSREEAAPPAAPAAAAAAAAPHAQRQQERHPAEPPRQHLRRRRQPAAAAAYFPSRVRLPVPGGPQAASPCPLRALRAPTRSASVTSAAPFALQQQPRSLARTRSGSGAHPGTARDVTEGGRWLLHIHETRTPAPASALPGPDPQLSSALLPLQSSCSSQDSSQGGPGGRLRGALRPSPLLRLSK